MERKRNRIPRFAMCLVALSLLGAQTKDTFDPVSRLAGSCWEGTFPDGVKDVHCWEWALGGAFLRDSHELRGAKEPYGGETFYGWDKDSKTLRFWYFNTLGGRSEGTVQAIDGEERWLLLEDYTGATPEKADATALQLRNFLTIEENAYVVVTEQLEAGTWNQMMSIRFERTGANP